MAVFAIADLHLSIGVPEKTMDVFGGEWIGHQEIVEKNWRRLVAEDDLVLLPGDISWAKHHKEAHKDLAWIDALPGTKVMIRGNHDYWWGSYKKLLEILPPSIHAIQNNVFDWHDISIAGARLWDTDEYSFDDFILMQENPVANLKIKGGSPDDEKIFTRELHRLELSLKELNPRAKTRIAMTHYPPIGADLVPSKTSQLLASYGISICIFGHLHNVEASFPLFGKADGIRYVLTACDYLKNVPMKILD